MRRGLALLVLGVLGVVVGVASAHATGVGTATTTAPTTATTTTDTTTTGSTTTTGTTTTGGTTTSATTTSTTTTSTTTTTRTTPTTVDYRPLAVSTLRAGCVGDGVAAVTRASHRAVVLGAPTSRLAASGYPESGSVIRLAAATVRGSGCAGTTITLRSVSLFRGAVTARTVEADHGVGSVMGLTIDGAAISHPRAGGSLAVAQWGLLTMDGTAGRLRAPLVIRLLRAHDGLPAATTILLAFSAAERHERVSPPPEYPATPFPFRLGGGLARGVQNNRVVSIAMRYLGVPYVWGGATPTVGFDCSGLVKYVFAQLGVVLPHYAAAQWDSPDAIAVPADRLRAGDLVFFTGSDGTWTAPGHVGIYVGDGYLIDAPHTGARVRIDSLDERWFSRHYVGAKRIVGVSLTYGRRWPSGPTLPALVGGYPFAGHLFGMSAGLPRGADIDRLTAMPGPVGDVLGVATAGADWLGHALGGAALWGGTTLACLLLAFAAGAVGVRRARRSHIPSTDNPPDT